MKPSNPIHPLTLVAIVRKHAVERPDEILYRFLPEGEDREQTLTFGELDESASTLASLLLTRRGKGERALLLYPDGLEYLKAFFGCLYAGVIAVPAYPPRRNQKMQRLQAIIEDCRPRFALTDQQTIGLVAPYFNSENGGDPVQVIATDEPHPVFSQKLGNSSLCKPSDIAFIQYTSGSTGNPKGVLITHSNLLSNVRSIETRGDLSPSTKAVIWLPPFHDMGLIGGVLLAAYTGFELTLMPAVAFLQQPARWLRAMSRFRATFSISPNFGYELCSRSIGKVELLSSDIDLSSWKIAVSGAEPIRASTVERFCTSFKPYNFHSSAFAPSYGMAEATLVMTAAALESGPKFLSTSKQGLKENRVEIVQADSPDSVLQVSCGFATGEDRIEIVDPMTQALCLENTIGEVWFKGASVGAGYWDNPEMTAASFQAFISATNEGPFLRTGDLGFIHGRELYITGRLKDLIIIRGQNHYPQDIELSVSSSHASLNVDATAAFSIEVDGEEKLVVVQEVKRSFVRNLSANEVLSAIQAAIASAHGIAIHAIVLLKPAQLPKTSSGKIQRKACQKLFVDNGFEALARFHRSMGSTELVANPDDLLVPVDLKGIVALLLGMPREEIPENQSLLELGFDSLMAAQLASQVRKIFHKELSFKAIFECSSIAELSVFLDASPTVLPDIPIQARSRAGFVPLSYSQEGLWFLDQFEGQRRAYHLAGRVKIAGQLQFDALKKALELIVERHEILRTNYPEINGVPSGFTHSKCLWRFEQSEEQNLEVLSEQFLSQDFDLSKESLFRTLLVRIDSQEHYLLINMHHIIADGWSISLLTRELSIHYAALCKGESSPMKPLALQYADYAIWQREYLQGEVLERQAQYWQAKLAGVSVLALPMETVRPRKPTFHSAKEFISISPVLGQKLSLLSQSQGASLFMTLLAAFKVLLARYSGQNDICVGTPVANRTRAEVEPLIGFFANTLALRSDLAENLGFVEFLRQERGAILEAYEHQDLPFDKVVDLIQPERSLNHSPLFQVMFVLQSQASPEFKLPGLSLSLQPLESRTAKFDLTLELGETSDGLMGSLEYKVDLFTQTSMKRLCEHFTRLLESIVENPTLGIHELDILTETERHQILVEWNNTASDMPKDKCLHQIFEEQVLKAPGFPALVFEDQVMSYEELNIRANQLAYYLSEQGVKPDALVGVCMERSLEMVIALLGILKSGGAYVPLDPYLPKDRLDYMISDSSVQLVLTQEKLLPLLANHPNRILLDSNSALWRSSHTGNIVSPVSPRNMAYVIYTSGSTGRPKGAINEHRGVVNRLVWMQNHYKIGSSDRILQKTPMSFDVSVWEFFCPLISGATLVIARPEGHKDSVYLAELCERAGITTIVCHENKRKLHEAIISQLSSFSQLCKR